MIASIDRYTLENWKKHGILCCGYSSCYGVAEVFMRRVVGFEIDDPTSMIMLDLECGSTSLDEVTYSDLLHQKSYARHDAIERIYRRCVENGDFFESFLKVCAETKLLDPWFLSEEFMSNVWAGGIHGHWTIKMQNEESKEPYRNRFRKFIKSLDDRGLEWTKKYCEPDSFWRQRKVYWQ